MASEPTYEELERRLEWLEKKVLEHEEKEHTLRRRYRRLDAAVESLPFDFFALDADGRYTMQNTVCVEHWGDLIGKRPQDLSTDSDTQALWLDNNRRALSGETVQGDVEFPVADEQRHFYNIISPILKNSEIEGIVGINIDITSRKRAEEALRESEEKWRSLVGKAPSLFLIVDRDGIIQYVNNTVSGIEVEKVVGTSTYDYTLPEYHKVMKESIKHVLETGQVCRYETKGGSPGGDLAWYITQAGPIKKESQIVAVALIATDITERKQAEDKLRKSGEELRDLSAHLQTVREQERAIVAREIHDDLGQTLNVLKLDFHWLEENLPKDQEALIEKTQSMTKLVDMMVQSVRRIYSGLRPFVLDDLGLVAAIEWMAQKFQNQTEMECELFISPKDIVVDKDLATPIFRIFQDALSNVRRHANATSVKVRLEEAGKDLILIVSDNGKGITEKQVSDSKAFGLMGMRERALSFRGETNIRGIQNEGTTVKVKIPRRK